MSGINADAIERELDRIRSLDLKELRREWVRLYHSPAPRISRDLLVLGLAYRVQETEYGGLGKSIRRKLQTISVRELEEDLARVVAIYQRYLARAGLFRVHGELSVLHVISQWWHATHPHTLLLGKRQFCRAR